MKKMLIQGGIYTGIFIVMNVGMFFLLKMTQPKSAVLDAAQNGDSTAVHNSDSTITIQDIEFDEESDSTNERGELIATSLQNDSVLEHGSDTLAKQVAESEQQQDEQSAVAHSANDLAANQSSADWDDGEGSESPVEDGNGAPILEAPNSTAEIAKLAKLLEGMKPDEAAVIAERLPTETIVQLVMRMKSRSGAKMMASLPVPVAASVATRMAELSGVKGES